MWQTLIAVLGTLAGALAAGIMQARIARTAREAARADDHRRTAIDAVTELAVAVSDHRRAMWEVGDAQLTGADADRVQALRDETHRTRSAITAPAVRVQLLAPAVQAAARIAIQATYAMRNPQSLEDLETLRGAALVTHDELVAAAAGALA
ncbi:pRL2-23 [Streptomyces sp. BV333]|uniref:pRL2-23 n=1 Tax=Streptomyces sp. BV333 TaxID=2849673 RepID=UPI001C2E31C0|nr:pRL2-23 [Streptomyces sp. BV333]MBV1958096.1 pRL2-23 [Streptomyces sp. BV333]